MECRAMLEELSSQLPKLQVQYQENSTVVEVRQVLFPSDPVIHRLIDRTPVLESLDAQTY
jgi:hypothetical protein